MAQSMDSNFTSMHPTVQFLDISEAYSFNADLHCKLKFNDYTPREGDRIAILKIGWNLVRDYVVFEWAPFETKDKMCSVTFNRHILPKNSTEVYQICYVSSENEIHGASTPFQFYSVEDFNSVSSVLTCKSINTIDNMTTSQIILEEQHDQEITRLKEDNALLKDSLKALLSQNKENAGKNYDKDIQELKELTEKLQAMLLGHEKELDMLKSKITEGGEEYKKLYLEKAKVERKYEKLKSKCSERQSSDKEIKPIDDPNFDIGDLKSMPPFPSFLK